jgi:hypothetical protein
MSMHTEKNYTPQRDSLAAQVVGFFTNNPTEELSLDDVTDKFMCPRANVHTQLGRAVQTDLLSRSLNDEGDYIYRAGGRLASLRAAVVEPNTMGIADKFAKPAKPGKAAKAARAADAAAPTPMPEIDAVVIESNIPIPGPRQKRDWTPLLCKLGVGQSFKLPIQAAPTMRKCITQMQAAKMGTFTAKQDVAAKTLRVWRTT